MPRKGAGVIQPQQETSMSKGAAMTGSSKPQTAGDGLDSDLGKLFEHQLKDMYFAEKAIVKALPKMMKAARASELKGAFETHLGQTEEHVRRLERVFEMIGRQAEGTPCEAIKGIIKEGDEVAEEFGKTGAADAGLAASAQAVEHYEIARYGTLIAWAKSIGRDDCVQLLEETLSEEKHADALLTEIAETEVNQAAA
jgi:ferritin-like metal-binding protein YciE